MRYINLEQCKRLHCTDTIKSTQHKTITLKLFFLNIKAKTRVQ